MRNARTGSAVPIAPTGRQHIARRLEAARILAGRTSLRTLAEQTGMSYRHRGGIANGNELAATDQRDLAAVVDVPSEWLRNGWTSTGADILPGA